MSDTFTLTLVELWYLTFFIVVFYQSIAVFPFLTRYSLALLK